MYAIRVNNLTKKFNGLVAVNSITFSVEDDEEEKKMNRATVYVLWLREMKRFFRAKSRVVGNLAMPLFFLWEW